MADQTTDTGTEEQQPVVIQPGQVRGKYISNDPAAASSLKVEEHQLQSTDAKVRNDFEEAANAIAAENAPVVPDEEQQEETAETNEDDEQQTQEEQQPETQYIEDPGEFQSNDYSFEVTVLDADGNKPKTVKVTNIEQWEELLDSEPNLGSSLAVNKAFRQAQKMESGTESDRKAWEEAKAEYDKAVENEALFEQRNSQIFNEMQYMINRGNLPKLTQEESNSLDWSDKAVIAAHPNIKPHNELLTFMRTENLTRLKAGLAPLNSALDAYNAMQLDTRRQQEVNNKRERGEARKEAGARISGTSSAPISSNAPKGVAVGRVGLGILR